MVNGSDRVDLNRAMLNPSAVFLRPEDVVERDDLTREQKIEILRRWVYDARQLDVAEEENMGGEGQDMLYRVLKVLDALGATPDAAQVPSTEQGGG